jgi:hypothetical protein
MFIPNQNFSHPGSEFFHPGTQIRIKELKHFNPKIVPKLWEILSGLFGIRILIFYPSRIPDPGGQKTTESRIRNTDRKGY